jgi:hypothetical protein
MTKAKKYLNGCISDSLLDRMRNMCVAFDIDEDEFISSAIKWQVTFFERQVFSPEISDDLDLRFAEELHETTNTAEIH